MPRNFFEALVVAPGVRRYWAGMVTALVLMATLVAQPASAVTIQTVKSPGGITAWLVEDHSIPLIALRFAFTGGAALDPKSKAGLANLVSSLLDEGAGELTSKAFQTKLQEIAARLSYQAGKDWFTGRLQTLTRNSVQAFDLLRLSLTQARFDAEPVERMRSQIAISIRRAGQNPSSRASRAWMELAFKDHPYARPTKGNLASLAAITSADLKQFVRERLVRKGLKIVVVGDITPAALATALDKIFASLPATGKAGMVKETKISNATVENFIKMDIPQTIIQFGHAGLKRHDKDFIPAFMVNYILGGGGFTSRLTKEIRVKRGLTYSVYSQLHPLRKAGLFIGGASTRADRAGKTVELIKIELAKMAAKGPTPKELEDAKTYLTGSYALRFDSNSKIAGQLLGIRIGGLGIDYVKRRNGLINAVTIVDVKRVAARLLLNKGLIFTIVGKAAPSVKPQPGKKKGAALILPK